MEGPITGFMEWQTKTQWEDRAKVASLQQEFYKVAQEFAESYGLEAMIDGGKYYPDIAFLNFAFYVPDHQRAIENGKKMGAEFPVGFRFQSEYGTGHILRIVGFETKRKKFYALAKNERNGELNRASIPFVNDLWEMANRRSTHKKEYRTVENVIGYKE